MNTIGIIGANGDLGSQLAKRIQDHEFDVRRYSRNDTTQTIQDFVQQCDIVHVCAPVIAIKNITAPNTIIVLHDSVMNTSRQASAEHINATAGIVHMLMNDELTVVVASDAPHHDVLVSHFAAIELLPHSMTVDEHDYMIARSQAPLALLCKTLLPYLYTKSDQGLLTPSGQLLADTLRARELIWTDETIHSILQNPQLQTLLNDMQTILDKNKGI